MGISFGSIYSYGFLLVSMILTIPFKHLKNLYLVNIENFRTFLASLNKQGFSVHQNSESIIRLVSVHINCLL